MAVHFTFEDSATPMIDALLVLHQGYALEALGAAGGHLRKAIRAEILNVTSNWAFTIDDNGTYVPYITGDTRMGMHRYSHKTGAMTSPSSMANFVTSYIDEKNLMAVVGGVHRSSPQNKYRDGKIVGSFFLGGVGRNSLAILEKVNYGSMGTSAGFDYQTKSPIRNPTFKARFFINKGKSRGLSRATQAVTERYSKAFKSLDAVNIQPRIKRIA